MTIYNLGSINADLIYRVSHLPKAGETLAAASLERGLGGKGANMSVAAARAAARVVHIGAVGADGAWAVERLMEYGVDTRNIATVKAPTGHAVIAVDDRGENSILLYRGANQALQMPSVEQALSEAAPSDTFLFQNEVSLQLEAVQKASAHGLRVAYAAAPFEQDAVQAVLPMLDLLVLNAVEAKALADALGTRHEDLPVRDIVITLGKDGCRWINTDEDTVRHIPAMPVTAVDTTGAGDTFTGYLVAGLDRNMPMEQALMFGTHAAAIMVTRRGTADVIPDLKDLQDARFG